MNQATLSCPKCGGEMIDGFVIDHTSHAAIVSRWAKGKPKKAKAAFGILPVPGIEYPQAVDLIPVSTFRCQSCSFLESYAREEFAVK